MGENFQGKIIIAVFTKEVKIVLSALKANIIIIKSFSL